MQLEWQQRLARHEQGPDRITKLANHAYAAEAKVGQVKCPSIDVPRQKGLTFFCTVAIDGVPLRLTLRETDAWVACTSPRIRP